MDLSTIRFGVGSHEPTTAPKGDRDLCIMEAVAYMAGEPWSDTPSCASPVVAAFLRSWNDELSDDDRDRLLPASVWVPRLVGSCGDDAIEERRAYLALDWLVRVNAPAWLDHVPSLASYAAALRALPEIVDLTTAEQARGMAHGAEAAAWDAAWDAGGDAARVVVGEGAWDAAGGAWDARAAAGGAWDAAWDAAGNAARAAAGAAAGAASAGAAAWAARDAAGAAAGDAGDAARAALRPTVETLQQSAIDLLDRMLACGEHRRKENE